MGALAAQVHNLRHTMAGGGADPPPLVTPAYPAGLSRTVRVTLILAAVVLASLTFQYAVAGGAVAAVWTLSCLPLALVGYRPLLAWRVAWLLAVVSLLLDQANSSGSTEYLLLQNWMVEWRSVPDAWFPIQVVVFLVTLFAVGTAQHRGVLLWVWLASAVLTWFAFLGDHLFWFGSNGLDPFLMALVMVTAVPLAGYLVRLGARAQHRLAAAQEQGTVLTERARIARELHDVVAHHVSMIAVRAETAPYRLEDLSAPVRAELAEISEASRQALGEMRRLLGVLRSDDPAPLTAPQPGLADLPELISAARSAGSNEVTLNVDTSLPELPAAVDVSAYRIVQEALTNAARHAPGAPVRVVVGRTADGLYLSVRNGRGRTGTSAGAGRGPGHGVRGMRERAGMLGGDLRALPTSDGGFEVSATLPVSQ